MSGWALDDGWVSRRRGRYHLYRKNFRVTKQTFNVLLTQLQSKGYLQDGKSTNPLLRVPGRFKLGVCLYFFGQGTG